MSARTGKGVQHISPRASTTVGEPCACSGIPCSARYKRSDSHARPFSRLDLPRWYAHTYRCVPTPAFRRQNWSSVSGWILS
eukprot:5088371-Pleurochrysis_carterae.AAC.1